MSKKQSFSDAYKQLQDITQEFEQEDIDLEKSIPKFKEAAKLVKFLKKRLSEIENEIEKIDLDLDLSSDDSAPE